MIDTDCFDAICKVLALIDHNRHPGAGGADCFGTTHIILFGDFKQLPPATSKPAFIVNQRVIQEFSFRCLHQNRRVVEDASRKDELETFHTELNDIAHGRASNDVWNFIVQAYVRGAKISAETVEFEGRTAVLCLLLQLFFIVRGIRDSHGLPIAHGVEIETHQGGSVLFSNLLDFVSQVFTKRRYRDRFNRTITRRVSKKHNHSIKTVGGTI